MIAFPFAYFMARLAGPRLRAVLFVLVLLPLWASYLARVYAWQLILNHDGLLNWCAGEARASRRRTCSTRTRAILDRLLVHLAAVHDPAGLCGPRANPPLLHRGVARPRARKGGRTLRSVILPLALPGVVAGSIFTFSLTLGDYITPSLVGGPSLAVHRQRRLRLGQRRQPAVRGRVRRRPGARDGRLPRDRATPRRIRGALDGSTGDPHRARRLGGARPRVPLRSRSGSSACTPSTLERPELADPWTDASNGSAPAIHNGDMQTALWLSLKAGMSRDRVALALGTHGVVRRSPLQVLRPDVDLVPARPADLRSGRPAR